MTVTKHYLMHEPDDNWGKSVILFVAAQSSSFHYKKLKDSFSLLTQLNHFDTVTLDLMHHTMNTKPLHIMPSLPARQRFTEL